MTFHPSPSFSTDKEFMRTAGHAQAGSTATTVLLLGNRAYCGNVGDSRTVLCRSGEAVPLSDDHKPSREDEAARIKVCARPGVARRVP